MKPDLQSCQALVFDLDGTLIDSEKYHVEGFARAVEALSGYCITEAERREFFESHTTVFTPVLADRHGLTLDAQQVLAHKRAHVRDHFKTEVFPDAYAFIQQQRGRFRLALASNSPSHFVHAALEEAGLADCFEVICTADDVTRRKPDPEMYLLTLQRLSLPAHAVLVFEDSPPGVRAAQAAGCPVWMIENGSGRIVEGMDKVAWRDLM